MRSKNRYFFSKEKKRGSWWRNFLPGLILFCFTIRVSLWLFLTLSLFAQEQPQGLVVKEISLQESYRKLLEENKQLKEDKESLQEEVRKLTARINLYVSRINVLSNQVDSLNLQLESIKTKSEGKVKELEKQVNNLQSAIKDLERLIKEEKGEDVYDCRLKKIEREFISLSSRLQDYFTKLATVKKLAKRVIIENQKLKEEGGKVHYNLGNFLFRQGEYTKAAYEYESALKLLPGDPDIYYNLAIIYDYYLKDAQKAAHYYQEYLRKMPQGEDSALIKERIIANQLKSRVEK